MNDFDNGHEKTIRSTYEQIARRYAPGATAPCCCGSGSTGPDRALSHEAPSPAQRTGAAGCCGAAPAESGLGCACLTELVSAFPGESLLDVGSGPGLETIAFARRVDPGPAIGLDLTPAMVDVAMQNAREAGVSNVRFLAGRMEDIPLEDGRIDIVVSNCVVNLSSDKPRTLAEMLRVLRPGGRLAIADIVWLGAPPEWIRRDASLWASCVGGALEARDYPTLLEQAGFTRVNIEILGSLELSDMSCCAPEATTAPAPGADGSREHADARGGGAIALASALVTARKPGTPDGPVETRPARREDLDLILRILQAAGLPGAGVEEHLEDFIVAQSADDRIAGVAGLEVYPSAALLRSVVVLPSWRGRGLGRRLVEQQLSRLSDRTPVYLLTTTAEAYFRAMGFEAVGTEDVHPEVRASEEFRGACPVSAVIMRRALG